MTDSVKRFIYLLSCWADCLVTTSTNYPNLSVPSPANIILLRFCDISNGQMEEHQVSVVQALNCMSNWE